MQQDERHDLRLRTAASVIFHGVRPTEDWAPVGFEEAERRETIHYRETHYCQTVAAALLVRPVLSDRAEQLCLI